MMKNGGSLVINFQYSATVEKKPLGLVLDRQQCQLCRKPYQTQQPFHLITLIKPLPITQKISSPLIFFKQPRTICLLHSTVCVFSSFTNTTHNVTQNQNEKKITNSAKWVISKMLLNYSQSQKICAEKKSLEDGKRVHSVITSNGMPIDEALGAKLVFMYVNSGDLVQGRRIFDEIMNDKVFLWNLLMSEYAKIDNFRESVSFFCWS
ncbi:hypothetical protein MtrunA17_Chr4g0017331 [Medicago truncatula]|uniref:Uncharacterized protein n=1 Tax=Medicago truncatula TaxID=3880 RepID=A0A396I2E4_MEDTR|nr:hypothetical protein MtrunA17_Chr4g0017331 [Medicago truncatula]